MLDLGISNAETKLGTPILVLGACVADDGSSALGFLNWDLCLLLVYFSVLLFLSTCFYYATSIVLFILFYLSALLFRAGNIQGTVSPEFGGIRPSLSLIQFYAFFLFSAGFRSSAWVL